MNDHSYGHVHVWLCRPMYLGMMTNSLLVGLIYTIVYMFLFISDLYKKLLSNLRSSQGCLSQGHGLHQHSNARLHRWRAAVDKLFKNATTVQYFCPHRGVSAEVTSSWRGHRTLQHLTGKYDAKEAEEAWLSTFTLHFHLCNMMKGYHMNKHKQGCTLNTASFYLSHVFKEEYVMSKLLRTLTFFTESFTSANKQGIENELLSRNSIKSKT